MLSEGTGPAAHAGTTIAASSPQAANRPSTKGSLRRRKPTSIPLRKTDLLGLLSHAFIIESPHEWIENLCEN